MTMFKFMPGSGWFLCLIATVLLPLSQASAQVTPETCQSNLGQADNQIANGFFDEAIALLEPCRDVDVLSQDQQARTFKLLADAYLAKQYVTEARGAIAKLLELSPNFTPDVNVDSPTFRNLLAEIRAELVAPALPDGFTATRDADQIVLAWSPVQNDAVDRLVIHRGNTAESLTPLDSISAGTSGYTDTSVLAGQTYFYALQSIGTNGVSGEIGDAQSVSMPAAPTPADDIDAMPSSVAADKTKSKSGWGKWALIGGGIVAGGIVAAVSLGGGGGDPGGGGVDPTALPGPPSIP